MQICFASAPASYHFRIRIQYNLSVLLLEHSALAVESHAAGLSQSGFMNLQMWKYCIAHK